MKEQDPANQDRLTTRLTPPKLEVGRDNIMSDEPGGGEGPPRGPGGSGEPEGAPVTPIEPGVPTPRAELTPEKRQAVKDAWARAREKLARGGIPVDIEGPFNDALQAREDAGEMPPEGLGDPETTDSGSGGNEPPSRPTGASGSEGEDRNKVDLNAAINDAVRQGQGQERMGGSFDLYLTDNDKVELRRDHFAWLESKFDMIYDFADQGQELNSPILSQLQNIFTFASTYLVEIQTLSGAKGKLSREDVKEFTAAFTTRLSLIFMRSQIDHKNMDGVKQMALSLQAHGLLSALAMENGNVHRMYTRMAELLEDQRLAQEDAIRRLQRPGLTAGERHKIEVEIGQFHVRPAMMAGLQDNLLREQFDLAKRGIGPYSEAYAKAKADYGEGETAGKVKSTVESQIRRAVRTAYDAFVVSQRQAILVSRGHVLPGADRYMSDPAQLMNVFNQEDLLTNHYTIYNVVTEKFLDEMKLDMARSKLPNKGKGFTREEQLDFGTRLFRDLYAVPDFFSSSWRINGILRAIEDRFEAKGLSDKRDDFALFLRLKQSLKDEVKDPFSSEQQDRISVWERIAEIRPEEIVRLYRERAAEDPLEPNEKLTKNEQKIRDQFEKFFQGEAFNGVRKYVLDADGNPTPKVDAFRTYDEFKRQLGPIVQLLRQNGYKEFRALRIGSEGFTDKEEALITRYFDGDVTKAAQLQGMFAQFTEFAKRDFETIQRGGESKVIGGQGVIYELMTSNKFEDIYTRTLLVDDALLDILESGKDGIMPISKTWTSENSTDALVRCYGDMDHAIKAGAALLNFVYKEESGERIKKAEEFAEEASQYNGQEGRAKCIRYTVGTFLNLSKQSLLWDGLGIGKLPFRQAMSKIEEIYGPQAKPMSRDTLQLELDRIHTLLISAVDTTLTGEERDKKIKDSDSLYQELRVLLETTPKDMVKRRAISFLFFLILGTLLEAYHVVDIKPAKK